MNQTEKINFSISADYILNIVTKLKSQEQEIENLKNINEILINHIKTLDNRSKNLAINLNLVVLSLSLLARN